MASDAAEIAANVSAMLAEGNHILYTVLTDGDHASTWRIAYTFEGVRDWLFAQVKTTP
jgi:predicted peptidase